VEERSAELYATLNQGNAELALGRLVEAKQAFEQAHALALAIGSAWRHDANCGLARVAMARTDLGTAHKEVKRLIEHVDAGGTFADTLQPRRLELTCSQVLESVEDPRASEWLERAHTNLQATASSISDAKVREGYLTNISAHREIVAVWKEKQTTATWPKR
jgi:tetratricopeptide (TPR) repeat protein